MKAPSFAMAAVFVLVLMANSHGQVKSDPNAMKEGRVTALLQKAESLYEQGKIEAARVECHKAFLIDPYDVRVHRMIVRVPLILKDSGDEVRSIRVYRVTPPDSAMEMQRIRFRAISTGKLPPALNPQLGK